MKNRLELSNKIGLKQKIVYASLGIGLIVIVSTLGFFYLFLGNGEKVIAAAGENKCLMTVNSSTGYDVHINAKAVEIIAPNSCDDGYSYQVKIDYIISFSGDNIPPSLSTLQGYITCGGSRINFDLPNNGGAGSFLAGNAWTASTDCATVTPASLNCMTIEIEILGEGIPKQTITCTAPEILPISLLEFKAEKEADNIHIEWSTSSETNNDYFTLERSDESKTFETIATIDGAGNSNEILNYRFEDKNPEPGMNYYRLKQTDYNGDFEYFKIVALNFSEGDSEAVSSNAIIVKEAYPNPFKSEIKLDFEVKKAENIEVIIQNARGEVLYQEAILASAGANNYIFTRADELNSGIYYINLKSDSENFKPQRIVKL